MGVDSGVVGFILRQVLVSDKEWARGWKERKFDPTRVAAKIEEGLDLAAERADERGLLVVDVPLAEETYAEIRKSRQCVYPIRKC
jgi:hypothetical protein